jgi:phage-related minor tail protein
LAVAAGTLAIQAAVIAAGGVAAGATALAAGGVVSRPTMALIGERGPEAVIPLNQMSGMGGQTTIIIQLDGREIARNTLSKMPGLIYMKTGLA